MNRSDEVHIYTFVAPKDPFKGGHIIWRSQGYPEPVYSFKLGMVTRLKVGHLLVACGWYIFSFGLWEMLRVRNMNTSGFDKQRLLTHHLG